MQNSASASAAAVIANTPAVTPAIPSATPVPLAASPATPPINPLVTPALGPHGTTATINGAGFGTTQGSNTITVGGASAEVVTWSDTSITFTVPSVPVGPVSVVVNVNGVASNAAPFNVTA